MFQTYEYSNNLSSWYSKNRTLVSLVVVVVVVVVQILLLLLLLLLLIIIIVIMLTSKVPHFIDTFDLKIARNYYLNSTSVVINWQLVF